MWRTSLVSLMMAVTMLAAGASWGQQVTNQITAIAPSSAAQGTANLLVTFTLDTDSPPAPPANVLPQSVTLGSLSGTAIAHTSQYTVIAVFTIPAGEAVGAMAAAITFQTPGGLLTFSAAASFSVTAAAAGPEIQLLDGTVEISDGTGSVNFGGTTVGAAISKTFTVKNIGTSTLTLTAPISVPSGFTVTSSFGATALAAGASTTFTVRLNATTVSSYSGTLSFANSDSNENPYNITINGSVVAAGTRSYPIVDTAQTKCYNATAEITAPAAGQAFYGQDAQCAGNQPSYTLSSDGLTVTDNVTGLTWQRSPDTNNDGNLTAADKLNWTQAQARPAALNSAHFGGYSDWRLPTIKELYSLICFNGTDPRPESGSTAGLTPFINTAYFQFAYGDLGAGERIIDSQYASSTLYVGGNLLFGVNFADGRIKGYGLTMQGGADKTFFVQCVRGNTGYGINAFTDNGDQTITDTATGLMWSKTDSGAGMNWQDALAWVQTKNAANYLGHNDWRLPNAKELQSIIDYTRSPGTTNSAAINPLFSVTTITGENGQTDYPWYWSGTTHASSNGSGAAGAYLAFGHGWGYMNSTWVDIHGAGCQRSDPKSGSLSDYAYAPYGYYNGNAPQSDAIRLFNYVRLVRDAGTTQPAIRKADALIRNLADTAYLGDNIYNTTGTGQTKNQTLDTFAGVRYVFRVQNDGSASEALKVTGTASTGGWTVRYYDAANVELTSQITGSGWNTGTLAVGDYKLIWANVSANTTLSIGTQHSLVLTAASTGDVTQTDVVKAVTTIGTLYQPDLWIRKTPETTFSGNGIYNLDGAAQTRTATVTANSAVIYAFRIQNDGNTNDSIIVTGTAGDGSWVVQYYTNAGINITTAVTGSGWNTGTLSPTDAGAGIYVRVTHSGAATGATKTMFLTATSVTNTTRKDVVKMVTTRQ